MLAPRIEAAGSAEVEPLAVPFIEGGGAVANIENWADAVKLALASRAGWRSCWTRFLLNDCKIKPPSMQRPFSRS